MSKRKCVVAIGSNLGDSKQIINNAVTQLSQHPQIHSFQQAKVYQTKPVSSIPQPDYLNSACQFETDLPAAELLKVMESIERSLGKVPKGKEEPRLIDLDLIFYDSESIAFDHLTIPHPRWKERSFVLIPLLDLMEIAPTGDDIRQLLQECTHE